MDVMDARVKQAKAACFKAQLATDKAFKVYKRAARSTDRAWDSFMRKVRAQDRAVDKYAALMKEVV